LFENIYQLEPGENILINLQNLNINKKKYWDLKNGADYNTFFNKIPESQFKQQFESIIQQHSIADKLPALSLSGGIDSYIVMNYFTELKKNCSSFTLGFENKSFDESKYVKKIKKKLNKQIYYANDKELISSFLTLSKLLSEPIGDSSIIPTYIIHNKIKDYSNVSLGGDGGDETFFGYITFDAYYLALKLKKIFPNFFLKIIKKIVGPSKFSNEYITFSTKVRKFFNSIHLNTKYLLVSWMGCLSVQDMGNLFNERIDEDDIYDDLNNIYSDNLDLMRCAQLYYFKFYLPMVLTKVDQASMFNSVESRSPFLSKKIINFSLDHDVRKLYKFFKKKYFIRKIFSEEVPMEILNRKKHGFAFPKEIILQDKKLIENLLDYNLLTNRDFFKTKYSNFLNKTEDCSQYIWNELILNITLQNLNKSRAF
jgi:asparagine synthase (glutamine-hydrolysing)